MRVSNEVEDGEQEDPLPDGTKHVVLLYRELIIGKAKRYAECLPDDLDLESTGTHSRAEYPSVTFEAGDEIPLPIARDCYEHFGGRMGCFDEDKMRLDDPSRAESGRRRRVAQASIREFQNR